MHDDLPFFVTPLPAATSSSRGAFTPSPSISSRADATKVKSPCLPSRPLMHYAADTASDSSRPHESTKKDETKSQSHDVPRPISIDSNFFRVDAERVQLDKEENLRGFVKTRGSLIPGEQFVFWWVGDIYDMRDGQSSRHLFGFEGFNIGRMMRVDGGWRMLSREVGLYKDKDTGEILHTWVNPDTEEEMECVHVWNDPVNQQFLLEDKMKIIPVPTTIQGDDIYWHTEVFLKYPSPLQRAEYPEQTASDLYQSTEMFQFFSKKEDLASEKPSADCLISWVRVGQWLPWMGMGDKPGKLVYHCRGRKLMNGYEDLSEEVKKYVAEHHPEYAEAPTNYTTPNETSWTYMKKLLDAKGSPRADGTVARPEPKREKELSRVEKADSVREKLRMTNEELAMFDGRDEEKPIYLSVCNRIFDVTSARRHYRKGETYNCLTGKDASHAFVSGDLSEEGLAQFVDLNNLSEDQQSDLEKWVEFFSKNYPEVGVLEN